MCESRLPWQLLTELVALGDDVRHCGVGGVRCTLGVCGVYYSETMKRESTAFIL